MNQEKIGKFIAERRKAKRLTQVQLGERLGVTDRSVSKWENGKCMPDLSLFEPLCDVLDIRVNELLSGEEISSNKSQEKFEENIINTIDYSKNEISKEHKKVSLWLIIIGIIISISALTIFETESSWSSIYSVIGIIIFTIGVYRELKIKQHLKKLLVTSGIFILILGMFFFVDYLGVMVSKRPPIYRYTTKVEFNESKIITYNSLFYKVYRINADTVNEYYIIDTAKKYTSDNIPISPFNRDKSGIDTLIKYKNKYVGNNSNDGNLINSLPLSEYGCVFKIDSKDLGLIIDYHTTDWYSNENNYIQKSLIYNSVSFFMLIDNIEYVTYNFSGNSYTIKRIDVEKGYQNYSKVIKDTKINMDDFNKYVEKPMNDYNFIMKTFEGLF